jgi:hypothetical protein
MVATVDDVLAGVRALWAAAGLPAAVAGGLNDSRAVPATFAPPAAVVKITPGEKMTTSANLYFEKVQGRGVGPLAERATTGTGSPACCRGWTSRKAAGR